MVRLNAKRIRYQFLAVSVFVLLVSLFFVPEFVPFRKQGNNMFHIFLNGEEVGTLASAAQAKQCLRAARRQMELRSDDILYIDADMEIDGEEVMWGKVDSTFDVINRMIRVLTDRGGRSTQYSLQHCYTVKMGQYTVNLRTADEVKSLLNEVLETYDPNREYVVNLVPDPEREISVLTSRVLSTTEQQKQDLASRSVLPLTGIEQQLAEYLDNVTPKTGDSLEDFDLGLQEIGFAEKIEVAEAFMPENQISTLEDAVSDVTGDVSKNQEYTVQSGDSISVIASRFGLTSEQLVAMNPLLASTSSTILPGDILTVSVQEPKLSVVYTNQEYYEEDYSADTVYKKNDSWYTTKQAVIQDAETGHRKVVALVNYKNGSRTGAEIVKQVTTREAVPQIIEIGTKNPPTFIWPVSGGRISSGFGNRARPKAGASTYHQGTDIAVPVGTAVMASSGGTVTIAGWQSGYGNVVYINHGDGKVTRYGHLSRILVSVGQTVSQGQVIARSGNTGNSTGPHLHFELRVNGTAVNVLNYVNQ